MSSEVKRQQADTGTSSDMKDLTTDNFHKKSVSSEDAIIQPILPTDISTPDNNSELNKVTNIVISKRNIDEITVDILHHKVQAVKSYIAIGNLLIEAKSLIYHGGWLKWLSFSVDISLKMAERYMLLARSYANSTAVSNLGIPTGSGLAGEQFYAG